MQTEQFMQKLASLSVDELAELYAAATKQNTQHAKDTKRQQVVDDLKNIKPK